VSFEASDFNEWLSGFARLCRTKCRSVSHTPAMCFAPARSTGSATDCRRFRPDHKPPLVKWQDNRMSDRKLRIVGPSGSLLPQPKDDAFSQLNGADRPGSQATAEENLRLIKSFSVISDNRRRAWLLELVEHFAGLDAVKR
jgi:hypothetical protein